MLIIYTNLSILLEKLLLYLYIPYLRALMYLKTELPVARRDNLCMTVISSFMDLNTMKIRDTWMKLLLLCVCMS
jgi:hypothetical protein